MRGVLTVSTDWVRLFRNDSSKCSWQQNVGIVVDDLFFEQKTAADIGRSSRTTCEHIVYQSLKAGIVGTKSVEQKDH